MRILFMGTPEFAVASLAALHEAGYEITSAVTQPDKPKGRGYTLTPPPVKIYAEEHGIRVHQPDTLRGDEFAKLLESEAPELIAVAAYGKLLPQNVLDYPKYGCINVHGSLLPKYRGAAPIQRAIMAGERTVGVTTMYMAAGLDTGDMLLKAETAVNDSDNFETVHDRLADIGARLLVETVGKLMNGTAVRIKQNDSESCYAAKIEKNDCIIDFSRSAEEIAALVRGLSPYPLAFAYHNGKILKIVSAAVSAATAAAVADANTEADANESTDALPGTVISIKKEIKVKCGRGILCIKRVVPSGKGAMNASDFINGRKIAEGDILSSSETN